MSYCLLVTPIHVCLTQPNASNLEGLEGNMINYKMFDYDVMYLPQMYHIHFLLAVFRGVERGGDWSNYTVCLLCAAAPMMLQVTMP